MDPQQPAPSATPVAPVTGNVLDGVDATLQGAAGLPSAVTHDLSVWSLFLQADWIVKGVMIFLLMASIWSWAIIFDKIIRILNDNYSTKAIDVAGFTDTDPIKFSPHKDNYYLGFARAYAVREYLVSKGIDGTRISLSSFGPDQPRDTKSKSRRVEIVVVGD